MKLFGILTLSIFFATTAHAMKHDCSIELWNDEGDEIINQLFAAVSTNDCAAIRELLKTDSDANRCIWIWLNDKEDGFQTSQRWSLLSIAIFCAHEEMCRELIKAGATIPDERRTWPSSDLMFAAYYSNQSICKLMLEKMLSIPTREQKETIRGFTFCLRRMCPHQFHNICNVFKPYLQAMIRQENSPRVFQKVKNIAPPSEESEIRRYLLDKYFPSRLHLSGPLGSALRSSGQALYAGQGSGNENN